MYHQDSRGPKDFDAPSMPQPLRSPEHKACFALQLCAPDATVLDSFSPDSFNPSPREGTLLRALEEITQSSWRWAGANLVVERIPPYRVLVLVGSIWQRWRAWRDDLAAPDCELQVELYTPLC